MADLYRRLVEILREHGCRLVRSGKASLGIWYSPAKNQNVSVPRTTKSRHTANEALKKAGLPKAF